MPGPYNVRLANRPSRSPRFLAIRRANRKRKCHWLFGCFICRNMTDLRLGRLQDALRAKEEALEQLIGEREGIEVERSADPSDEAQLASERELKIRALDRDFGMLCEVRLALQRINDGGYGLCQNCDEWISEKRL